MQNLSPIPPVAHYSRFENEISENTMRILDDRNHSSGFFISLVKLFDMFSIIIDSGRITAHS